MKLAFITSIDCCDLATTDEDIFYVLAHLLDNPVYYKKVEESRAYKILDNSVHEGVEIEQNIYYEHAFDDRLGINEIILQDCMEDSRKTLLLKEEQLNKYYEKLIQKKKKIMLAVQGKEIKEIITFYESTVKDTRIDVIGLSFTLKPFSFCNDKYLNTFFNRLFLLKRISLLYEREQLPHKPTHLLGSSSWLEPIIATLFPFVRSNDSKILSRISNNFKSIEEMPIGKPAEGLNMEREVGFLQKKQLINNISKIKNILNIFAEDESEL